MGELRRPPAAETEARDELAGRLLDVLHLELSDRGGLPSLAVRLANATLAAGWAPAGAVPDTGHPTAPAGFVVGPAPDWLGGHLWSGNVHSTAEEARSVIAEEGITDYEVYALHAASASPSGDTGHPKFGPDTACTCGHPVAAHDTGSWECHAPPSGGAPACPCACFTPGRSDADWPAASPSGDAGKPDGAR